MTIVNFAGAGFQAGDQTVFSIQADMGFVTKEILGLYFFFTFSIIDFVLVLYTPLRIRVGGPFPFFFRLWSLSVLTLAMLCTLSTIWIVPNLIPLSSALHIESNRQIQ